MIAAKRLIKKAVSHHHHHHQQNAQRGNLKPEDLDLRIAIHYGIPSTSSLLAFDPIQGLLAVGTLDGRIKVIGGDGIEGLLISPKQSPFKNIEFLQNQGFLVTITNENDIQVWNLESRCLACSLQWESNITASSVISGSYLMLIGDECGTMSVVKYDNEGPQLLQLPYFLPANSLKEAAGYPSPDHQPIVGILPQPCSSGNRVLIAYQNGLMILWDVSESQILFVGGGNDLQLKDGIVNTISEVDDNIQDKTSYRLLEKEISALCWASSGGSILAVGYIDGDILFWKIPTSSKTKTQQNEFSSNIVRLQLSTAEKRLPVIVLDWSKSHRSSNDCDGQLFIYGGDEIGSDEVLTVLNLEWSSKMETLRCAGRVDLTMNGSFADMILLPSFGPAGSKNKSGLALLTNPGQLHLYGDGSLSVIPSQHEKQTPIFAEKCPAVVPIVDPIMTVAKLVILPPGGNSSKILHEVATARKNGATPAQVGDLKLPPLTGGVPSQSAFAEHATVERVYVAGYEDGSVRLWNATYPVLSLIYILESEMQNLDVAGFSAPVSNLEFCSHTLRLAIGNTHGLVRIYNLNGSSHEKNFCILTETKNEVHSFPKGVESQCSAVISLVCSPIHALEFANSGAKLAVGFECGRVAVLDMTSPSVLFFTDSVSPSNAPVIAVSSIKYANTPSIVRSPKHSEPNFLSNSMDEIMLLLTRDATITIIDSDSGGLISSHLFRPRKKSTAISMYVIEGSTPVSGLNDGKQPEDSGQDAAVKNESLHESLLKTTSTGIDSHNSGEQFCSNLASTAEGSMDSLVLLCCEDSLHLYSAKNIIQGNKKAICKVKHAKLCCWTATFTKDDMVIGVVLLFQTGVIEIRSFPDLELVKESSLMSILRWSFKANMEKIMSSEDGQITLANGCELVFISLLSGDNFFSTPDFFPCLHDKVLAAAADAAFSFSLNQKEKQGAKSGIINGFMRSLKGQKVNQTVDIILNPKSSVAHLEGIFAKPPFPDSSPTVKDSNEVAELDIDDIEIDDEPPPHTATSSSQDVRSMKRVKGAEREQLLGMSDDDMKPRLRTPEEIRAKYRNAGDATSVAADARNKLAERQEKLERISRRTAELQSGAEDFASLANELVKAMENRKWWQI